MTDKEMWDKVYDGLFSDNEAVRQVTINGIREIRRMQELTFANQGDMVKVWNLTESNCQIRYLARYDWRLHEVYTYKYGAKSGETEKWRFGRIINAEGKQRLGI